MTKPRGVSQAPKLDTIYDRRRPHIQQIMAAREDAVNEMTGTHGLSFDVISKSYFLLFDEISAIQAQLPKTMKLDYVKTDGYEEQLTDSLKPLAVALLKSENLDPDKKPKAQVYKLLREYVHNPPEAKKILGLRSRNIDLMKIVEEASQSIEK